MGDKAKPIIGAYILMDYRAKKLYIGSSQDVHKRFIRHVNELKAKKHHNYNLQEVWDDGGRLKLIVYETKTREDAFELEQALLNIHKDSEALTNIGLSSKGGDNLTRHRSRDQIIETMRKAIIRRYMDMTLDEKERIADKQQGEKNHMFGKTHTSEARKKISIANLGITRRSGFKLSESRKNQISEHAKLRVGKLNPFFGRKHTEETRRKLSLANKGTIPTNSRKVLIDGTIHLSVTHAARALKVTPALIIHRIKSKRDRYSNYQYLNA